jgi:predicted ATPase/DNA-binding SARP family transcriptional activator
MQIAMLGPLEVRTDAGELRAISGVRLARLLIALALQPGRVVTSSYLVDAVWDEAPPDDPGNAVQALVSRLRRAAPGIDVARRAQGYVLDIDPDSVDVRRFEALVEQAGRDATASPAMASDRLREALALWRGPALVDAGDATFAHGPRARLDELRLDALQARIEADLRRGAGNGLIAELEGLVVAYPLREPFVKLLMRALHAAGDRGRALAVYDTARKRLDDDLGVSPSADLAAEHVRILRADDEPRARDFAEPRSAAGPRRPSTTRDIATAEATPPPLTNLRAEISSFVGRERDIAALDELIAAHRLVTLTGPGGAGKTRLAGHVARGRLDAMPDGVWMVEFAPVTDPADLVVTVLDVLGVRDRALVRGAGSTGIGRRDVAVDPLERLLSALRERHALLVLDNCEHLLDAAADLAGTILGSCPGVRIMATSREPIGLTGEALWPVEPLAAPPVDPVPSAAEVADYPAVRLLLQRAAAARPGFAITDENAGVIARVVRALDGMPLAIELAAARLRAMTVEQLASRLDDRFTLLIAGSRTAMPRHQTLRAVVDWSWDLLNDPERVMWRRLSVFTGGATLAAAERQVSDGALGEVTALDALTSLVDRSLLAVRDEGPEPRYHMLETIRAYGQLRLDESGEEHAAREAHAAYFDELAVRARDELFGRHQLEWFAKLSADHDNLNAAVRHANAAGDVRNATRLVGSLGWYWWLRGHRNEGTELIKATVAIAGADPVGEAREELAVAYTVGALLTVAHEMSLALEWFDAAAALADGLEQPVAPLLRMLPPLRTVFLAYQAVGYRDDMVTVMPVDDDDTWVAAASRLLRAHIRLNFGRAHDAANDDFAAALELFRARGERWGIAFSLLSLGLLAAWRGDIDVAVSNLEEAIERVSEMGAWEDRVGFGAQLARLRWLTGDKEQAYDALAAAERDAHRIGVPEEQATVAWTAADFARFDGDLDRAQRHIDRADQLSTYHDVAPQLRALVIGGRGYLDRARGDLTEARRNHRLAVEIAISSVDAPVIAQTLVGLADVALADDDPELAAMALGASTGVRGMPDLSLIDGVRITELTRRALGSERFDAAYQRGLTMTTAQIGERAGVELPELTATPNLP